MMTTRPELDANTSDRSWIPPTSKVTKPGLRLDHVAISVQNIGLARKFYEALGARVTSKPASKFLEVEVGGLRLHMVQEEQENCLQTQPDSRPPIDHICFNVADEKDLGEVQEVMARFELPVPELQSSPSFDDDGVDHVELNPPTMVMYGCDPFGIRLEFRAYRATLA